MDELVPTTMVAGGDALARDKSGRVVFVRGALPGERVAVRVVEEKKDFSRAEVVEVLEASPWRQEAPCPMVAAGCGGCSWQHISPEGQVHFKLDIVKDALRRTGRLSDPIVVAGPALATSGYRTSVRLGVDASGRLGYRRAKSHEVLAVDHCMVAHPGLGDLVADYRVPHGHDVEIRIGVATGERTVMVDGVLDPDFSSVLHEAVAGHHFRVSAESFFQTRTDGAEQLTNLVRAAGPSPVDHLVDAYGGVGLFAATSDSGSRLTLIESSASSCRDAETNLHGRVATVVEQRVERWKPVQADRVVADPARRGLGSEGVAAVAATGTSELILVSCDPVSLARDAYDLSKLGFVHDGSTTADLFPHTSHVEVVTRFVR